MSKDVWHVGIGRVDGQLVFVARHLGCAGGGDAFCRVESTDIVEPI